MKGEFIGHVSGVFIAPKEEGSFVTQKVARLRVNMAGIPGDYHSGLTRKTDVRESKTGLYDRRTVIKNDRQVSVVSDAELDDAAALMGIPHITPESIGANISTTGIPELSALPPFTRLKFERGAVIVVSNENHPCVIAGKEIADQNPGISSVDFKVKAKGLRGVVGFVEKKGVIQPRDSIQVITPPQRYYSLPTTPQES